MSATLLQMSEIVVRYGDLVANDRVQFDIRPGEIHALLGENGAGKSTLMKVLSGLVKPESGRIEFHGRPVHIDSPVTALQLGIGMVHQHFMLIPSLTVAQNLCIAARTKAGFFPDLRRIAREMRQLGDRYGLEIDPDEKIANLSVGQQQRVEIIKALYRGAQLLILDEPTAVLTPQETASLFAIIRNLTAEKNAVIFISHKLQEVMTISDRITILRAGVNVSTRTTAESTVEGLAEAMVGRHIQLPTNAHTVDAGAPEVLRLRGVHYTNPRGVTVLKNLDLAVRQGEIHGIAGVDGNGQDELTRLLSGLIFPNAGQIWLEDQQITHAPPAQRIRAGLATIPGDRQRTALLMGRSLSDNAVLEQINQPKFSRAGFLRFKAISAFTQSLIAGYDIRCQSPEQTAGTLSGGNQQKLVLARVLERHPRLIIAVQPTRGLDIGATEYVRSTLLDQCARGAAVLLISTELDEVLALSNRISVMYNGTLSQPLERATVTRDQLGLLMGGRPLAG
ncbi:MAG: ABC transporter ATP-binding protein [Chloroflexi bacterium]|uniref:ABC transporter ATP-binding protein n=1 Tax=Candidatus Flexifilum breve TaxID=3140694 RepID=UPI0031346FA2|nr:ABC transporter ATP-binding protein [Chloroflexota bacterium]